MRRYLPLLTLLACDALADEGMWTVDNFPADRVTARYGVEIDRAWLDRIRLATTRLEGGCSGSFVSPNGLVLTNRHCVWDCVSEHNSAENNIWDNGFVARHPGAEMRCGREQISVLMGIEEITADVERAVAGLDDAAGNVARKQALTRLEQACEEAAEGDLSCESVSLYNGGQYFLYKYRRYDDVRLVFAPEDGISAFGGDLDNFNFPRWNLDMAFLRVYVDDQPAETPDFLTWRAEGADVGEPVFVSGHPGSTERLLPVSELKYLRTVALPDWLARYTELRGRYKQFEQQDSEAYRLAQHPLTQIENGLKVRRNEMEALLSDALMRLKLRQEEALREAVDADPELGPRYGSAWAEIARARATYLNFRDEHLFVEGAAGFRSELFDYARTLVRATEEREKPNEERLREYTDAALPQVEQRLLADVPVHDRLEVLDLTFSLDKMREFLGPDDPFVHKVLGIESPRSLSAKLVATTKLADAEFRRKLWEGGAEDVRRSRDPMIRVARMIDGDARDLRKRYEDEVQGPITSATEKIARARFAVYGTSTYPDATFTLRISYGAVEGWEEKGGRVAPFTTVERLFERATEHPPFRLPETWIKSRKDLDMDTRFNFVATTDITGGNSGSPLVDREGRLVGLAFDGNIHSIAGAFWFDERTNRTVAVHPAIMLQALENVYQADHLVAEITGRDGNR
jgi:hypothetical protein